uniref:Uncharacterized protein n=1 Tax=Glossina austeni TaxID=7395 RepID=A0A1A9UJH9_GLOAU
MQNKLEIRLKPSNISTYDFKIAYPKQLLCLQTTTTTSYYAISLRSADKRQLSTHTLLFDYMEWQQNKSGNHQAFSPSQDSRTTPPLWLESGRSSGQAITARQLCCKCLNQRNVERLVLQEGLSS